MAVISIKVAILIFGIIIGMIIMGGSFLLIVNHFDITPLILVVGMQAMYLLAVGVDALSHWANTLPL